MYITIANQEIYFQKVGRGPDLILLHGWGQDVSTWWGIISLLQNDFTLWLIDLPGFGRSQRQGDSSVKDMAEVVIGFIEKNKLDRPNLLGHSLGGRVAIKLAATNGKLIDRLILEDSAGLRPKHAFYFPILAAVSQLVKNFLPESWKRDIYRRILRSDYYDAGEGKGTLQKVAQEDLSDDLTRVENESLILWGEKDEVVPFWVGKRMYQLTRDSWLEVIDGAGHFPHLEAPERFVYWVRNFLL